ncbi:MAG: GatB/YqeY domain-containing protein [bacterium]
MLRDRIINDMKQAMKAKDDKTRLGTLRLVNAAIKDRDIAARSDDRVDGVSEEEILAILTKMVKQREESAKTYEDAGRIDLADQERAEIDILREYLPKQMSEEEIQAAVTATIDELGAEGLKDMGRAMGALKVKYAGAMDFGIAGAMMKKALG